MEAPFNFLTASSFSCGHNLTLDASHSLKLHPRSPYLCLWMHGETQGNQSEERGNEDRSFLFVFLRYFWGFFCLYLFDRTAEE